jgi:hypothetical protein
MPIKFECTCGRVIRAPGGSEGRRVRCPACQARLTVPGGGDPDPGNDVGLGVGMQQVLEWQDRRRAQPAKRPFPKAEQWLMEHGLWMPLGIAIMALFAVVGVIGYAADLSGLASFSGFMFLLGLCSFLYGRYDFKRLVGRKDEEDRPEE